MNVAQVVEELKQAIESPSMKWAVGPSPEEHPDAKHYVGTDSDWTVHVIAYGEMVDGSAFSVKRFTAVHLTPAMSSKARELAEKAT